MTIVKPTTAPTTSTVDPEKETCCPNCGTDLSSLSLLTSYQKQISDLQSQISLLNEKATAAVDRWADYEDELSKLRLQLQQQPSSSSSSPQRPNTSHGTPPPPPQHPQQPPRFSSAASRISSLLSPRKSSLTPFSTPTTTTLKPLPSIPSSIPSPIPSLPSSYTPASPPPSVSSTSGLLSTEDLLEALNKETARRQEVESRLSETSKEVEELSVSLFEQANEMVASERRARAKLEERVGELEKRDLEKRKRLEVLERGVERIERVRGVLSEGGR
ncbi:hypothetical protein QBC38DRAFT_546784 [Podospora fimiseda]|uniref:GDP/GTP exchange factor Sec2 N-terminal domain-containing protein n=1 Tax=Podospora fimiseda TaxID=252190 RepID=A0AAN7BLQ4_9PEZI|nr:hypothetical protein QBC38DRAFT_546784 [Podospora fimiseda]